ncbi:MAG: XamI family restriction endonuclease [Candidatus Limnocylindria bacterium]
MNAPPRWTHQQLTDAALVARAAFREQRLVEPLELYMEQFEDVRARMEDLLETTVDLSRLTDMASEVMLDPRLFDAVRYLASPPIAKDDLKVLAEANLTLASMRRDPDESRRAVAVVLTALDRNRFPWVGEDREPSEAERGAAILASAAMTAVRRVMTSRQNDAKTAQEESVADALAEAGLTIVPGGRYARWMKPLREASSAPMSAPSARARLISPSGCTTVA